MFCEVPAQVMPLQGPQAREGRERQLPLDGEESFFTSLKSFRRIGTLSLRFAPLKCHHPIPDVGPQASPLDRELESSTLSARAPVPHLQLGLPPDIQPSSLAITGDEISLNAA